MSALPRGAGFQPAMPGIADLRKGAKGATLLASHYLIHTPHRIQFVVSKVGTILSVRHCFAGLFLIVMRR